MNISDLPSLLFSPTGAVLCVGLLLVMYALSWLYLKIKTRCATLQPSDLLEGASILRQTGMLATAASIFFAFGSGRPSPEVVSQTLARGMGITALALFFSLLLQIVANYYRRRLSVLTPVPVSVTPLFPASTSLFPASTIHDTTPSDEPGETHATQPIS